MSRSRPLLRSLLTGVALAGTAVTVGAPAAAAPGHTTDEDKQAVAQHLAADTEAEQDRITAFWTPRRMEAAVPASTRFTGEKSKGDNGKHNGQDKGNGKGHDKGGKPADGGEAVPATPQPELGKVFFTLNGTKYVCSGTATQSGNADVVTTAGHCVNEGPGAFATNFMFVPAYDNGAAPYGEWTAEKLFTTQAWSERGDFDHDVGFAVMNENDAGESLTAVTGSYPIAFNLERGLHYTSYGYPAAAPFDGQSLYKCTGTAIAHDPLGSNDQGLKCDMTGGSSGGGWITDGGDLNSVNSFKYRSDYSTMWGPYFGDVEQATYQQAATY